MALLIPETATFRRAEGLTYVVSLCSGLASFNVTSDRQKGPTTTTLSRDELRTLSRLSEWRTAEEVGAPHNALVSLVERNCLFWSKGRPTQNLVGEPLRSIEGPVALRPNQEFIVMGGRPGNPQISSVPVMPRMGVLDGAELRGVALLVKEMNTTVARYLFGCCGPHANLVRDLIPALTGAADVSAIAADETTKAIVELLNDLNLLTHYTPSTWNGEARLTWLSHAGVLYEACGKRILVDPLHCAPSVPTRNKDTPWDIRNAGVIDAVLITHGDNDHLHPGTLIHLPRSTPIVIPSCPDPKPFHVDMKRLLEVLGFVNVVELKEWTKLVIGDVHTIATPFRGEDWGLPLATRTFLIHSAELTVFLNADSVSTPDVYDWVAQEYSVDVAFVGVTGCAEAYTMPPGFGYGDFYAPWIPAENNNEWLQLCNGPREAAEAADRLKARFAFGYAAGGSDFNSVAYTDRGTHGQMAERLREMGSSTRPIEFKVGVPTVVPPRA